MQYIMTAEGYPALLKNRTRTPPMFFSERALMRANRTSPWVYLTQNPRGRWQVLIPDPDERGSVLCVAGASTAAQVLPNMVGWAKQLGILKPGTPTERAALGNLGAFVTRAHQAAANAGR